MYLRLLKSDLPDSEAQRLAIQRIVAGAPGVIELKTIEPHPKGGYAVICDIEPSAMDDVIEYLAAQGVRLLI